MKLPKEIFITNEHPDQEGEGWYLASLSTEEAVSNSEEKEPVNVGTYRLVEENELELIRTTRVRKTKKKK
jgi:hypothetical protein